MKKYISAGIIIILFTLFAIFTFSKQSYTPVLNIINPVTLQVDLNNNGIIDDNETLCIPDMQAFSLEHKEQAPDFARNSDLTVKDIISLGYMADNFSGSILYLQPVKVKLTGKKTPRCQFAEIYVNEKNYSDILIQSGYASQNGKFNNGKFKENLKIARNLKLVIYNIKSGKYHKLDCEYGLASTDFSILQEKQLPEGASPCKFCYIKKEKTHNTQTKRTYKEAQIQNYTVSDGAIKLILTDFTQKLKPDRNCDSRSCLSLLDEINHAESSIDIAVYGMDIIPKIYDALEKAKSRNVKIRMVYDKSSSPEMDYYTETESILNLADEYKSDYIADKPSYTNQLMHNKFFIFDNKTVYTGSANISATGLSDYNANAVIILNSADIARLYTAEFEQMLAGKFHDLKTKPEQINNFELNGTRISVYFSPYDRVSEKIIPLINNAEKYIYMPAFLITHDRITDALIKAKRRGIDVKIIIDANSTSTRNTKYKHLRENKIPLKTENYAGKLHSKTILIDDTYIITGSMNFSNSGENKNDENVLIIENEKLTREYKRYFMYLWHKIPEMYLTRNARAEGTESIGACTDGIDNDFDGFIDKRDSGCR